MILNTAIWKQTVEAAKTKAASSPAWLRAIDRAVIEIERASYWSFDGHNLVIISTTSGERYNVGKSHSCPAQGGVCKHRAARRLMLRYSERLAHLAPVLSHAPANEREAAILIKPPQGGVRVNGWLV